MKRRKEPLILRISIHSPRMGRDESFGECYHLLIDFNPLSPHGERLDTVDDYLFLNHFNPLSPHGERLDTVDDYLFLNHFNPLSPHGERQGFCWHIWQTGLYFNPLSPHGERPSIDKNINEITRFQSTLPAWGET